MTSKGKEIYNTIKRSLGSQSFGIAGSSNHTNGVRYSGGTSSKWIHPPDVLLNGRVEYSVKMLGFAEVSEPKGTHVIRDAIHAIRFQFRGVTGHSGAKLKKVDLQINVDGLTVIETKTKMILFKYPLHRISFCADDKQDKRVFSFIAKAESSTRHDCFVFLSEKLAEQITLTVGEAFDLAYQKFLERNGRDLENKKQLIMLRKRIAELEQENNELKEKLYTQQSQKDSVPPLPTSPMPREPPPGITPNLMNDIIPAIVPPPAIPRRHHANVMNTNDPTTNAMNTSDPTVNFPQVGKRFENLQLDKMEDLFDDEFDPRADERKKPGVGVKKEKDKFGLDPFGNDFMNDVLNLERKPVSDVPSTSEHEPTPEQFDEMLSIVDKRLTELRDGFASGILAMGDTGDAARDLHNIYSVPVQSPETNIGEKNQVTAKQNGHT
uniref:BMA-CED-6, isoform a n=1 Tax=Brugia malayi TaxID=6279 RepID=A0A0J9XQF5_BRUMA|nr:BMA-CED-6, isoform a [Brugia malayi]